MNKNSISISLDNENVQLKLFNNSSTDVVEINADFVVDRIEFEYVDSMDCVLCRSCSFEVVFPLSLIIRFEKEVLPRILHQRLFNVRGQKIAPL